MLLQKFILEGLDFLKQIYLNRFIIWELTKRDFRTKYINNLFGLSWAILEPLAMMVILWFIFTYVRTGRSTDVPFAIFLLTGLVAYDFFNKTLNSATRSIKNFGFLLNKVNFRVAIIPLVKTASEVMIHLIILVIVSVIVLLNGIPITIYWLQVFYYLFAMCALLTGLTWFTSSISLFFPDINYIITIVMRVLFFFTPIFWDARTISEEYLTYFRINPLFYLVNGYRDSFLFQVPFWEHPVDTLYFWIITAFFFILGVVVFKRLRPHFADAI
jgi:lipopolysaccharide transport system permease protein/teichoic acid transport system permease protein